jgi:hypothetical protein
MEKTHIEGVIDQILCDAGEHVQVHQDMLHVVVNIGLYEEGGERWDQVGGYRRLTRYILAL